MKDKIDLNDVGVVVSVFGSLMYLAIGTYAWTTDKFIAMLGLVGFLTFGWLAWVAWRLGRE